MHELSLAESLLGIVEEAARANAAKRVSNVHLIVGALSHVDPEALRFSFDVVKRGSLAADATVDIEQVPAMAWCMPCAALVTVEARGEPCPVCGSYQLQVQRGEELRVKDIEIA